MPKSYLVCFTVRILVFPAIFCWKSGDEDGDGSTDEEDSCLSIQPLQGDFDNDGLDTCDICPLVPNS